MLAAFVAGWVDAVVGGGGLIQLPALLIGLPDDTPPASILGTNKVSSVWGTATSSITYAVKIRPDWRTCSARGRPRRSVRRSGRRRRSTCPRQYFTPIVLVALVGVGIYTWRRPELGLVSQRKHAGGAHYSRTAAIGLGVGAYDGILGPGTGSFFVILLVGVLGYGFLEASAKAKIANLVTNLVRDRGVRHARYRCCGGSGCRWAQPTWSAASWVPGWRSSAATPSSAGSSCSCSPA